MKKHILTSTLLLSLGTATAITIGTTVPLASKNVVVNNKNTTNENVAPFTASTAVVKFRARTTGVVFTGATDVQTKVGRQFVTVSQPVATKDGYVVTN